jgi:hypothetical protein
MGTPSEFEPFHDDAFVRKAEQRGDGDNAEMFRGDAIKSLVPLRVEGTNAWTIDSRNLSYGWDSSVVSSS